MRQLFLPALFFAVALSTASAQKPAHCTFKLFQLPGTTGQGDQVLGINSWATVVGQAEHSSEESFVRYNNGGFSFYRVPGSTFTSLSGRNDSGDTVGGYASQGSFTAQGFLLKGSTFTTIDHPKAVRGTDLTGINKFDTIVGHYIDTNFFDHGFKRWSNGSFVDLDFPSGAEPTINTSPIGINDAGTIVGHYSNQSGDFGFIYHNGQWATLVYPGNSVATHLTGISNSNVIVGDATVSRHDVAFMYQNGAFKTIAVPNAPTTIALGIAPNGLIVGETTNGKGTFQQGITAVCR